MKRIAMQTPVVEMDGDEMTRVLWQLIKDKLILPYIELKTEYYDLGLQNRNKTGDKVTLDAALAAKKHGVAVKCATITPNRQRMKEYPELTEMWKSPNVTIRSVLGGTVFRTPIVTGMIEPTVRTWKEPITIARHAYGDVYKCAELVTDSPGMCIMTFVPDDSTIQPKSIEAGRIESRSADDGGSAVTAGAVWLAQHNTDKSIREFARSCFEYALHLKQDLWFSSKDTISKLYDGRFKDIFDEEYTSYKDRFEDAGIEYFYTLIDDAVARVVRHKGGFIWACKNYDGDVMSDMVSSAFGSLAMMTSVLVSPEGNFEYEAAHGTVTRHYYRYFKGEKTSTNPVATIFAWSGGLRKRAQFDNLPQLACFADNLEKATLDTIKSGVMTADLAGLVKEGFKAQTVNSWEFIDAISDKLTIDN